MLVCATSITLLVGGQSLLQDLDSLTGALQLLEQTLVLLPQPMLHVHGAGELHLQLCPLVLALLLRPEQFLRQAAVALLRLHELKLEVLQTDGLLRAQLRQRVGAVDLPTRRCV